MTCIHFTTSSNFHSCSCVACSPCRPAHYSSCVAGVALCKLKSLSARLQGASRRLPDRCSQSGVSGFNNAQHMLLSGIAFSIFLGHVFTFGSNLSSTLGPTSVPLRPIDSPALLTVDHDLTSFESQDLRSKMSPIPSAAVLRLRADLPRNQTSHNLVSTMVVQDPRLVEIQNHCLLKTLSSSFF